MTIFNKTVWAVFLLTALSLVMYGCGGGGGSSAPAPTTPTEPTEPTEPPEPMTHDVTLPSGVDVMGGMAEIDPGMSADIGDITFSCPAGGEACSVEVTADGATSTGGMATAAESQASLDRKAMAKAAEDKAAAERIAGLIGPMATLADADAADADEAAIVHITPVADDDNFGMPQFRTIADDDTVTELEFMHTADPAMIPDWMGGTYTYTSKDGNTMHTVVKYNDKAADKDAKYSDFFTTANAGSTTHRAGLGVSAVDGNGVLSIVNTEVAANHALFSGNFGPTTEGTYTFPGVGKVKGSFRGVPGTFDCASGCSSMHNKDGNLSNLAGTWTFEPDGVRDSRGNFLTDNTGDTDPTNDTALTDALAAIMVPGVVQDADFMIFGYWEQSVTDDMGKTTEMMRPFAEGKRPVTTVATVTGTATYSGPATGLYMMKTITPQGGVNPDGPFSSGQFTADAMLEANFGGADIGTNHQFSITGTISSFMDGYGMPIDADWELSLNRDMIGADAARRTQQNMYGSDRTTHGDGSTGTFGGVTDGGDLGSTAGAWEGMFYGPGADATATPSQAAGTFDGHFTNGHVRGAFAVDVQEE